MTLLLDLDETLIRESEARDQAALDFYRHFLTSRSIPEVDFLNQWHDLQERHFQRFTRGEISFQEHRRERLREVFSSQEGCLSDAELDARFGFYLTQYENNWSLYDDVLPFLERAKHCQLGIVSNGDGAQQRDKLRRTGIEKYFKTIIVSSEVGAAKPDPKIFYEACRSLSVSPEDCIFIGDRIDLDVEGSKAAGLQPIWLNRTGKPIASCKYKSVRSLFDIEFYD